MSEQDETFSLILAIADDELVMGHRHSEWTGWAPHIEEDIAFSSIAQDEIGHANLLYGLASEISGRSPDELALGREPAEYRNAVFCERPNGDWGYTLARHFLYEAAEKTRLTALSDSSYQPLAQVCEKLLREEVYHQMHADSWFRRLATGPVEGRHQLAIALSKCLPEAVGLFEELENEQRMISSGVFPQPMSDLMQLWLDDVMGTIEDAGLPISLDAEDAHEEVIPTSSGALLDEEHPSEASHAGFTKTGGRWQVRGASGTGGRKGKHTADFEALWDDLTKTYREEPSATW